MLLLQRRAYRSSHIRHLEVGWLYRHPEWKLSLQRHTLLITFQYFTFTNRHTRGRRKKLHELCRIVYFVVRLNVISFFSISSILEHVPKTGELVFSLAILIQWDHIRTQTCVRMRSIYIFPYGRYTHTFHTHAYVSRYLTRHYNIRTLLNDLFSFIEFA